jgi:hypothetical protein
MWFVLVIAVIVIAGWIYLANSDRATRGDLCFDDRVPVNAYENPYDNNESNDAPFEPDACGDASDTSSDGAADGCDDSRD